LTRLKGIKNGELIQIEAKKRKIREQKSNLVMRKAYAWSDSVVIWIYLQKRNLLWVFMIMI